MRFAWLACGLLLTVAAQPCTIFVVARSGQVFAAGNEDEDDKPELSRHYIRFVPGDKEKGRLGYMACGYAQNPFSDESGLNDAGLFYDFNALDKLDVAREGKPKGKFGAINEMLMTCRTVSEAVRTLEAVDLPFLSSSQLVLGDATGASAIVERNATTWRLPGLDYQIGTNFRTSITPPRQITCTRYKACDSALSRHRKVSWKSVFGLLKETAARPGTGTATWYSVACDLQKGEVNLFLKGDFAHRHSFNLHEQLAKGARRLDMEAFALDLSAKK